MTQKSLCRGIAGALLALTALPAAAITNIETNATIPFSFSNPGARSLGMGGAFLGLADDATAAYTNPAGLTRLGLSKQVSVEIRQLSFDTPYPNTGSFGIQPFNLGGVNYSSASDKSSELAFLSVVLPQDDWSIAFYRHQLLNYENSYSTGQIFFPGTFAFGGDTGFSIRPYSANVDLSIESYGMSFGQNITEALSWGAGLAYHRFEIDTFNQRFDSFNNNAPVVTNIQRGSDNDLSFSAGLLYRGSDRFSIGLTYRSAPSFDYNVRTVFNQNNVETANFSTPFKAPDTIGLGFAYRASDQLTLTLDVSHVGYSNLSDQVDDGFFSPGDPSINPTLLRGFQVKDQIEPRMGMEYAFATNNPFFVRAGLWRERERTLRFVADPDASIFDNDPVSAYAEAVLFSAGESETHYSVGFGWAFPSFQVDFAYDGSDTLDTLSLSGVYRWD